MPKGPQGQKRPADTVANAVMVARLATGEEMEEVVYVASGRKNSGKAGAAARAAKLSAEKRSEIAAGAASARWSERRLEMTEQARLMRTLFEHTGREHVDIKFLRGKSDDVSSDDICREANKALFQIDHGKVEGDTSFSEQLKQVDVLELVKDL